MQWLFDVGRTNFRITSGIELRKGAHAFWDKHPALLLGLSLLLGSAFAFKSSISLGIPLGLLCLTAPSKKVFCATFLLFICGLFLSLHRCPKVLLNQEKVPGEGIFHIKQVKYYSSPFNRSLLYKGTLRHFQGEDGTTYKDLPCNIYLPPFGKRPPANADYRIQGTLCQKGDYAFVLKPKKQTQWIPIPTFFQLAEWRFLTKQALSRFLKKEIKNPHAHTFLSALATGDVDERILKMEFGKVGLQHILAISGFHFALGALFLNYLLRLLFPNPASAVTLLIALTFYFLFLGNGPSIQRAYIAIAFVVFGKLFSLKISGLNALGMGLIIELLYHPLVLTELSFQLSFLCTLAILLYYPILHRLLTKFFPLRSPDELLSMSSLDKHGFVLSALLRKTLAVNLAVHLISCPVILFLFHKFPLLSIVYNLFFPACASLCLLLLFSALLFAPLLPFFSHAIHAINNTWTSMLLHLTSHPPALLDASLRFGRIPFSSIVAFLTLSLLIGILFHEKVEKKET
jgi:competence protein ComEC